MKPGHGRRGGRKIRSVFCNRGRVPSMVQALNDQLCARAAQRLLFRFDQFFQSQGRPPSLEAVAGLLRMRSIQRKRVAA